MKLYTEEQLRKAIMNGYLQGIERHPDYLPIEQSILKDLIPIELPSDEEIDEYIKSFPYEKHLDDGQYNDGVIVGAELAIEWVINKIKGGEQ